MSSTQRNKDIAREFFARLSEGRIGDAMNLMSADATWWVAGKPELLPVAGWHTRTEFERLVGQMTRRLKSGLTFTVTSMIAEGEHVAVEVESRGELTNGRQYNNEYHTLMLVSDGRIRQVREYHDTQHAYAVWLRSDQR